MIRELIKRDCLTDALEENQIERLAEALSKKSLSRWMQEDFKNILDLRHETAIWILIFLMDFTELLKELTRDNQVYFLLHNQNLLNGCSGLPALMDKLLAQDPSWKNLKTELNISDAFVAENKSNIQKFIYEGGAEIMTSFLNRQPKKKEEIRRIVNAELLGKFMELKYHGGDLGREIAFPIKRDTEEIWKEKLLRVDCGWEIWEEDSLLPVMQIGEVPLRSCISYRNGPNCDCLLSCFDANKKIIFIKHNGKIVFRAILRLTKGSFVAADERKTIEFVDVTVKSEPHENKAEELVLFLERYYQSGLNMKLLEATDELIKLAKEDVSVRDKGYYTEQLIYQRGLYLRAEVENNILKVAFYLSEYLSMDCRKPVYTLYIDKKNDVFKGYDYRTKKWSDSMLDKTIFSKWLYQENSYMKEADTALIQKYLESEYDDALYALYVYQREQKHRRLGMKYEKILTSWDQCMDRLPKIPKDWLRWQKKVGITQNFIFYHYSRRKDQTGYCSWCESEVPISHPHHNAVGHCPKCRHQIQYKALGRAKNIETSKETAYLLQTCGNNVFVLREFQLQMLIVSSSYKKPVYSFFERRRILYDEKLNTKEYYFGRHHWTKESRWIQGKLQVPLYPGYGGYMTYEKYNMGNIYGKSLYGIKNRTFRRTGFYEYAKAKKYLDPVSFFEMVRERPYLERLIKAGLYHLAEDIMDNKAQIYCKDSGNLGKALGIDRFRLKRLRTNNGGEIFLQWLLLEKAQNKLICDDVISWMCLEKLKPADLMFIMDRMAPLQIKNYLEKQAAESGESVKNLIKTWKDYLNMAIRVGVNVQDSVIYRARKLMQRHNEMIKEIEAKDLILRAGELEKKYPGLNRICRDLKKYEYADKEYQIVVPEKVDDILYEAKLMHHCVNNTETYYERMSQQESYILFLRKTEQPTEAYYTLEVEPDGTIRQTRTFYNQQNEDIELARDFLVKWQKQLKKKLAKEDYKLAVKSQSLRKKEIEELRSKGVRVNGVGYCNKLLAEILEEDLMEAERLEVEEQAA